ncbi:hypothetical protein [Actinophytocola sp.]|uniref:hypothetical protein n=1 Tax=Actinophytocola sp. TaxID=1872138 RepID=UPI00389B05E5
MKKLTTGVVAALLALTMTSCGDSGNDNGGSSGTASNTSSSDSGGSDSGGAVAWADKVCSGMKDDVAALTNQPTIDQSSPQAAKDGLVAYLSKLETSLDGMASAVQDAGDPPVDGGGDAVKDFLNQISTAKSAVTSAKSKIDAAPVNDPTAFQAAASSATQDLSALSDMDPTKSFSNNKELNDAYNKADSCKQLEDAASSPTS